MFDAFVRTVSRQSPLRNALRYAVTQRLLMEPTTRVREIADMPIREGRYYAELEAQSDPYLFIDDDVLLVGKDWVERGARIVLNNPRFAIVSCLSLVEGENMARPSCDDEIYPMHAVGQPMFIRKGICVDLPEMSLDQECGILHKLVLDKGFEMGLFHPRLLLRSNHMGHGFSSNPILRWGF